MNRFFTYLAATCFFAAACATGTPSSNEDDSGFGSGAGAVTASSGQNVGGSSTVASSVGGATTVSASTGSTGGAMTTSTSAATTDAATTTAATTAAATTATTTATTTAATTTSTTTGGCTPTNVLLDGGFEQGTSGPWSGTSVNFGTPICDLAGCGAGGGTGPAAGTFWAWFGGVNGITGIVPEIATVTQSVTIPVGMVTMEFKLEIPVCDTFLDVFEVRMDGTVLFSTNGADAICGQIGYQTVAGDISMYGDGNAHTLQFYGTNEALLFGSTNFMVDDVQIIGCL